MVPVSNAIPGIPQEWVDEVNQKILPKGFEWGSHITQVIAQLMEGNLIIFQEPSFLGEDKSIFSAWRTNLLAFMLEKETARSLLFMRVLPLKDIGFHYRKYIENIDEENTTT